MSELINTVAQNPIAGIIVGVFGLAALRVLLLSIGHVIYISRCTHDAPRSTSQAGEPDRS